MEDGIVDIEKVKKIKKIMPSDDLLFDIAEVFKVFGDTTRMKIISALLEAELCVGDIAEITNSTQSAISHQLRVLITTKYINLRKEGKDKKEAISEALGTSISSIIVSGLCFFGATFGVGVVSKIGMIASLCTLMSRGAIISMFTVIMALPAFLMLFDKVICKTTVGMKNLK